MASGRVLDRPGMLVNSPSALDPTMAPEGRHVFSLEVLYTPYGLAGGWAGSGEPRRWLEQVRNGAGAGISRIDWSNGGR